MIKRSDIYARMGTHQECKAFLNLLEGVFICL